jgi:ankyrin repeat protein/catechol 2,3-dioxygenase-like lactoylglutathione lyase family enzyme
MSNSHLPERASLEYLKKLAKDRLRELRKADPHAKLAAALLAVAQEHGFSSWRALKAEVEQKQIQNDAVFFEACDTGDIEVLRGLIAGDPSLVRASNPAAHHGGWTGLHMAAQRGHVEAVFLLLGQGADPNAREAGDNTYPLHWAAAQGHVEVARLLLDAGGDVHGFGDVHKLDAIGWASFYAARDEAPGNRRDIVSLLLERGARHHIFSAIVVGDLALIQKLVEQDPQALDRRMSRFEHGQTPVHFAISRNRYDILDLLIELGADLEAEDMNGHTAMAAAMLRGDREAMRRLHAAGAKQPAQVTPVDSVRLTESMAEMARSVRHSVPMIRVPDIARTLAWYTAIGFKEIGRHEDDGVVNWGLLSFGKAELMLNLDGKPGPHDVSLWFYTDKVDKLYELLKSRQFEAAQAAPDSDSAEAGGIEFVQHIYDPFYGGREFGVRDLNGYELYFRQPAEW